MKLLNLRIYSNLIYPLLLSQEERNALNNYIHNGYRDINKELRENNINESNINESNIIENNYITRIDSAISKFNFNTKLTTYRTIYSSNPYTYNNIITMCKKGLILEKSYTSTSLIDIFGINNTSFVSPNYKIISYEIEVPNTSKQCIFLDKLSFKSKEQELLLKRNSLIEVLDYNEIDNELNIKGKLLV